MKRSQNAKARSNNAGARRAAAGAWLALLLPLTHWACSGDSDSAGDCPAGAESCPCEEDSQCDTGLTCLSKVCVDTDDLNSASGGGGGSGGGTSESAEATASSSGGADGTSDANTSTSIGAAGVLNRGGATNTTETSTNTASTTGATNNPLLAAPCTEDADCGTDLICISAESSSLIAGGPAAGLCTEPCTDACADPAAICIGFGDAGSYCMPRCIPGDGLVECQSRRDMACELIPGFIGTACTADTDCTDAVCVNSECAVPIGVCFPRCGADSDCPQGRFCDRALGECVDEEPTGLGLGEACDPEAATNECQGFCGSAGLCMEPCTLGAYPTCGSDDPSLGTAECASALYPGTPDLGDLGLCIGLCDCASECPEGLTCISLASPTIASNPIRGRAGVCDLELTDDIVLTCDE
jgi:hypothetical protein